MSYYFAGVLTNSRFHLILHCFWIFSISFGYYWNTVFYLVGILFPFLSSPLFCKRCVYVFDFCILNWVFPGPWEFLWRAESCIYFVCVPPLCGVPGRYKFIWALWWCGRRDCTDFPFSLALQWRVRYGWNGEGGGPFFFAFFSLLSVFLAVGCLR